MPGSPCLSVDHLSAGNFVRVLIITCSKRKELLTVHRSAGGGGDVAKLEQPSLSSVQCVGRVEVFKFACMGKFLRSYRFVHVVVLVLLTAKKIGGYDRRKCT